VGVFGAEVFFWFGLHLTSDVGDKSVSHAVFGGLRLGGGLVLACGGGLREACGLGLGQRWRHSDGWGEVCTHLDARNRIRSSKYDLRCSARQRILSSVSEMRKQAETTLASYLERSSLERSSEDT